MNDRDGKKKRNTDHHDRLSAVEVDVRHLDNRVEQLQRYISDEFAGLRRALADQRQPLTAFAGWAAVILSLVYAFGAPLNDKDARHQQRLDDLLGRELGDAYHRGTSDQRFATLDEKIEGAIDNRKDIDAKHLAAQQRLSERIDEISHSLDNGLGRRIHELMAPHVERLRALERQAFNDR